MFGEERAASCPHDGRPLAFSSAGALIVSGGVSLIAREAMRAGARRAIAEKRAHSAAAIARAIEWRESRRCKRCGALGYLSCAHRPNGADGAVAPAFAAFPYRDHRTCDEWFDLPRVGEGATGAKLAGGGGRRIGAPVAVKVALHDKQGISA